MNNSLENREVPPIGKAPRGKSLGQLGVNVAFESITANKRRTLMRLETQALPESLRQFGRGGIRNLLGLQGANDFSFLITQPWGQTRSRAVGYCIARYNYKRFRADESQVHVDSLAIAPDWQGKGLGVAALFELLHRAEAKNVNKVSFMLRESTSYPVVMHHQPLIKEFGFHVTELDGRGDPVRLGDNFSPSPEQDGEILHDVLLHKEPLKTLGGKLSIPQKTL